ncbi:hypothetical protein MMC22_000080, partial [Lobaria immixta]|nr:hypothetical protein [Lobaria immixta]
EKLFILSENNEYVGKSKDKYNNDEDNKDNEKDFEHKKEYNFSLETLSVKEFKTYFKLLNSNDQENWAQDKTQLRVLLWLSPNTVYADEDLESLETMECALHLLFYAQNGQDIQHHQISSHVKYAQLPKTIADAILFKLLIKEQEVKFSIRFKTSGTSRDNHSNSNGHRKRNDKKSENGKEETDGCWDEATN